MVPLGPLFLRWPVLSEVARRRALTMTLKRALIAAVIIASVEFVTISSAGLTGWVLLNGLIAVPAAIEIAYGDSRGRGRRALLLIGAMLALAVILNLTGIGDADASNDEAILSVFILAVWILIQHAWPGRVRVSDAGSIAALPRRDSVLRFMGQWLTRAAAGKSGYFSFRHMKVTYLALCAGVAVAVAAGLCFITVFQGIDADPQRYFEFAADTAVGAAAVWFVGRRIGGEIAGAAAAVLWICCGIRLAQAAIDPSAVVPTAVVPIMAALAILSRETGGIRGALLALMVGAALVPICLYWPVLGLTAAITVVFALWIAGYVRDARWSLMVLLVPALVLGFTVALPRFSPLGADRIVFGGPAAVAAACASGCDGALPWEFLYPSTMSAVYNPLLTELLTRTVHWGSYQQFSIAPGWTILGLAALGATMMYRSTSKPISRVLLIAIAIGVLIAVPSRYLGITLPSLALLFRYVAPGNDVATLSLMSGFFAILLAGIGVKAIIELPAARRGALLMISAVSLLLDTVGPSGRGHPAAALESVSQSIVTSHLPVKVAFYPFLTRSFGREYAELRRTADRHDFQLLNESLIGESGFDDLAARDTIASLRAAGVRYVIVSLQDYPRRRELLNVAHVVLPADQELPTAAWVVPSPDSLLRDGRLVTNVDGTLVISLENAR